MITAQIATIPEREASCEEVIKSLLPQVDKIRIALNNYSKDGAFYKPSWLNDPKIEVIYSDNKLMDGYKFLKADTNEGYTLICDDDILYPPDFASVMVHFIKTVPHPSIISIMGKNLLPRPMESYAKGQHEFFRAMERHTQFYEVELIGMCGAIYDNNHVKINETDMVIRDSDVCVSVWAKQNKIRKYVIPHDADWCQDLSHLNPSDTPTMWLHNLLEKRDLRITKYINQHL